MDVVDAILACNRCAPRTDHCLASTLAVVAGIIASKRCNNVSIQVPSARLLRSLVVITKCLHIQYIQKVSCTFDAEASKGRTTRRANTDGRSRRCVSDVCLVSLTMGIGRRDGGAEIPISISVPGRLVGSVRGEVNYCVARVSNPLFTGKYRLWRGRNFGRHLPSPQQ